MLDLSNYAIVLDFDGTITQEDSNDLLVHTLGNEKNAEIEIEFCAGRMSNREAMEQHFENMHISAREYRNFISNNINIDKDFDEFLQYVRGRDVPLFVISAGFRQGIEEVLGEERLRGIQIFTNDLLGEPYISPRFAYSNPDCRKSFGPCGNCKQICVDIIRDQTNRKVIFAGDGLTDRCIAEKSELLFAKHDLARYCDECNLPYQPYSCFSDVVKFLKGVAGER